jgi:hypothetical protein
MPTICLTKDQRDREKTPELDACARPDLVDVYYKLSAAESQLRSGVSFLAEEAVFGKLREKQRLRRCTNL